MLTTNLLPPEEQKIFQQTKTRRAVTFLTLLATIACILDIAALLPAYFVTRSEEYSLRETLRQEESYASRIRLSGAADTARKSAAMLERLRMFVSAPEKITPLMERIFSGNPGIAITQFTIAKDGSVTMAGVALTRADLLRFEGALRDFNRFDAVAIPLSDIIQKQDIRFDIQTTLKSRYRL